VTPWGSPIKGLELQAAHAVRLTHLIKTEAAKSPNGTYSLVADTAAEKAWTDAMTAPLDKLATSTRFGPAYYYLSKSGRNTFFFPFSQMWYGWKTAWVVRSEHMAWANHLSPTPTSLHNE
jgi:hypothetical protein